MSPQPRRNLQNITLIRKEGWRDFVVAAPRRQPEQLTTAELAVLSPRAAAQYNTRRADWHANMGVLKPISSKQCRRCSISSWKATSKTATKPKTR